MAPIPSSFHQPRQVILPPPPRATDTPPDTVQHVGSAFSAKTLLVICAGTITIFIVSVLCWKLCAFIRFFSRNKVVGGGKCAATPYIKTWHGWAPLEEHEKRKARRKIIFNRLRQNLAWRSSQADYSWVWWDPAGAKSGQHPQDQDDARWISPCFRKYWHGDAGGAGATWNLCLPATPLSSKVPPPNTACKEKLPPVEEQHGSSASSRSMLLEENRTLGRVRRNKKFDLPQKLSPMDDMRWISRPPLAQRLENQQQQQNRIGGSGYDGPVAAQRENVDIYFRDRVSPWRAHFPRSKSATHVPLRTDAEKSISPAYLPRRRCVSDNLTQIRTVDSTPPSDQSHCPENFSNAGEPPSPKQHGNYLTWKHKVWGARMQRRGPAGTPFNLKGLAGRPGTLASDVLNSMISSPSNSEHCNAILIDVRQHHKQQFFISGGHHRQLSPRPRIPFDSVQGKSLEIPLNRLESRRGRDGERAMRTKGRSSALLQDVPRPLDKHQRSMSEPLLHRVGSLDSVREAPSRRRHTSSESDPGVVQRVRLTSPEIRLIDDLDRRLEWFSGEMEPGRQHPNFLLLHNHWLNGNTWRTYDPVSRVPSDKRRQYGDPRYNGSRPEPDVQSQLKYPAPRRSKPETPRLDSWRLAVNRARKSSGLRRFLKDVELFEGSADEPSEGDIDTAAWVLRRPPQGFEISSKQKNAYYEGAGGWCERLSDWEQIGRAYRVRKVVCEGGANRRRAMEVVKSVGGGCKAVARKVTPVWASKAKDDIDPEKQRRKERSGHGYFPRRRHGNNGRDAPTPNTAPMLSAAAEQTDSLPSSSSTSKPNVSSDQRTTEHSNIVLPDRKPLSSLDLATLCLTLDLASMNETSLRKDEHHVGLAGHATTGPCC